LNLFSGLSCKSRTKKLELFYKTFQPDENTKILDLGGEIDDGNNSGLQFVDSYPWKHNISVLNISSDFITAIKNKYSEIDAVVGDACALPWPGKHFDIVFSNAVIEHLGSRENQMKMASEIMRVGKNWFVTTPNRWFPFEFHIRLPFIHWLPDRIFKFAARIISFNHNTQKYSSGCEHADLRLLSARALRKMFPDSIIIQQRITIWPETLIATSREDGIVES